jgi:pimeloyl-ACP methyl ester carboxylesterase
VSVHRIASGDGTRLAVSDTGPAEAQAFVFVHGWAQARLAWEAQAPLAGRFRLICMDLRGHGESDAPQDAEAYADTTLWADDLRAVLDALAPRRPILVGWSYGARVIGAYLKVHGPGPVGAVALAGGVLALGAARADWMAGPDSPGMNRALYAADDARRVPATEAFVAACTHRPLEPAFAQRLLAANHAVSPLVRRALFKTDEDLRPVWAAFDRPALIVHGALDTVVPLSVGQAAAAAFPDATLSIYPDTGHAPFLEQPERFNADLVALAARVTPLRATRPPGAR